MTLQELKAQVAVGTLDVLKILDGEDISELPLDVVNALAHLYLVMLRASPYFYDWIETDTRLNIFKKLVQISGVDKEVIDELRMLSPPFFDFRDRL